MTVRPVAVLAALLLVLAACGDSGGTTTVPAAQPTDAATSTTAADPPPTTSTSPPASTITLATTSTTRPPATLPDLTIATECDDLVDSALAATQALLDEFADLTLTDLAALEEEVPPFMIAFEDFGRDLERRAEELDCAEEDLEAGLVARLDELQASGVVAELILEGLVDELGSANTGPAEPPAGAEYFDVADASHTEDSVQYAQDPPVGGPHHPLWQNCGFYSEPVVVGHAVHSLEHGAVWITYDTAFATDVELRTLQLFGAEPKVLVSPYDGLGDTPVVASAWGAQMRFESALDPELRQFVEAFRDATAPEPGAPCEGGIGEPE